MPVFRPLHRATGALALIVAALAGCSPAPAPAPTSKPAGVAASAAAPAGVPEQVPPSRVGRVYDLSPGVQRFGAERFEPAVRNQPFSTGDRIATEEGGHAVIQVGSTTVRIGPSTLVVAARLDDHAVRLRLDHGELAMTVRAADLAKDFAIETADGFFVPQQPSFVHVSVESRHSFGAVWRGVLRFEARDQTQMDLQPGQRTDNWREGRGDAAHFEQVAMPATPFAARAQKDDAAESRPTGGAGAPHVSPEMTGAADLESQGRWVQDARAGAAWLPPVPAGWAPFRDGQWGWVPPWGWTWIDDARWGFAPFHYGRWTTIGGRWAWVPGASPAKGFAPFAPATVAWLVRSENAGEPPAFAWVPLAPGEPVFGAAAVTPSYFERLNPGARYPKAAPGAGAGGERLQPSGVARLANGAVRGAVSADRTGRPTAWQPVVPASPGDLAAWQSALAAGRADWSAPPPPPDGRGEIDGALPAARVAVPAAEAVSAAAAASAPATRSPR